MLNLGLIPKIIRKRKSGKILIKCIKKIPNLLIFQMLNIVSPFNVIQNTTLNIKISGIFEENSY